MTSPRKCKSLTNPAAFRALLKEASGAKLTPVEQTALNAAKQFISGALSNASHPLVSTCGGFVCDGEDLCHAHRRVHDIEELLPVMERAHKKHLENHASWAKKEEERQRKLREERRKREKEEERQRKVWEEAARWRDLERQAREEASAEGEAAGAIRKRRLVRAARAVFDEVADSILRVCDRPDADLMRGPHELWSNLATVARYLDLHSRQPLEMARQCSATTTKGDRCQLDAAEEHDVCHVHLKARKRARGRVGPFTFPAEPTVDELIAGTGSNPFKKRNGGFG